MKNIKNFQTFINEKKEEISYVKYADLNDNIKFTDKPNNAMHFNTFEDAEEIATHFSYRFWEYEIVEIITGNHTLDDIFPKQIPGIPTDEIKYSKVDNKVYDGEKYYIIKSIRYASPDICE